MKKKLSRRDVDRNGKLLHRIIDRVSLCRDTDIDNRRNDRRVPVFTLVMEPAGKKTLIAHLKDSQGSFILTAAKVMETYVVKMGYMGPYGSGHMEACSNVKQHFFHGFIPTTIHCFQLSSMPIL